MHDTHCTARGQAAGVSIFVDGVGGSDAAAGSRAAPLRTLARALAASRALPGRAATRVTIFLEPTVIRLSLRATTVYQNRLVKRIGAAFSEAAVRPNPSRRTRRTSC